METNASNNVGNIKTDHEIEFLEDAIGAVQKSLDKLYRTRQRLDELRKDITAMVETWNAVFEGLEID